LRRAFSCAHGRLAPAQTRPSGQSGFRLAAWTIATIDLFEKGTLAMQTKILALAGAALTALLMTTAPIAAQAAELVTNGGFEDIGAGATPEGWGGLTYYTDGTHPGNVALPGWTVQDGSVDLTDTASTWGPAHTGQYSLDINGWSAGTILQDLNTVAGQVYSVSFAYSRNAAGAPDPVTADVTAGGQTFHVSAANDTSLFGYGGHMLWQTASFSFVGTGHDVISLAATIPGNAGVFFDDVSVLGPAGGAPEPGAWAMMLMGFAGMGAMIRRQRAQAAAAA
jgi:hypothetical protein